MKRSMRWATFTLCALGCLAVVAPATADGSAASDSGAAAAPDWRLDNANGDDFTAESLKGNVVVLEFWATWCGKCQANMPEVAGLADEYEKDNVRVIAVSYHETGDPVAYLEKAGLRLPVAPDGNDLAQQLGVVGTPTAVVLDPQGRVALKVQGAGEARTRQVRETIDRLLAGSTRTAGSTP